MKKNNHDTDKKTKLKKAAIKKSSKILGASLSGSLALTSPAFAADEVSTSLNEQTHVAVTIYNQDLALVKDQRQLTLAKGMQQLAFREVSARIQAETALLRSLTQANSIQVWEQNFDFDLLSPESLVSKHLGQQVTITQRHPTTGAVSRESAKILSINNGIVLQFADRIEISRSYSEMTFEQVPDNLRAEPTLVMRLNNDLKTKQTLELSYLTGGLSWQADYVAELSANDNELDLSAWVTLTNTSGTSYPNATLQLVAGDVHRVAAEMQLNESYKMLAMSAPAPMREMAEESLFEYHLYTLGFPTTLKDQQTKQVSLLTANGVPVKKQLELRSDGNHYLTNYQKQLTTPKVSVLVTFKNEEKAHLGKPMPKGVVRVYKRDSQGNAQFIGEDRIQHTPKNEDIQLKLGDAFDVTAKRVQTDFKRTKVTGEHEYAYDSGHTITLKNAKSENVSVEVFETIPGDWTINNETHKHKKISANEVSWQITVPAEGETVLKYSANVQY